MLGSQAIELVDTKKNPDGVHQLQLWVIGSGEPGPQQRFHFELRQAYMPNGKMIRHCVLDAGQQRETRQSAVDEGLAALTAA